MDYYTWLSSERIDRKVRRFLDIHKLNKVFKTDICSTIYRIFERYPIKIDYIGGNPYINTYGVMCSLVLDQIEYRLLNNKISIKDITEAIHLSDLTIMIDNGAEGNAGKYYNQFDYIANPFGVFIFTAIMIVDLGKELGDKIDIYKYLTKFNHCGLMYAIKYDINNKNQYPFNNEPAYKLLFSEYNKNIPSTQKYKKLMLLGYDEYNEIDIDTIGDLVEFREEVRKHINI